MQFYIIRVPIGDSRKAENKKVVREVFKNFRKVGEFYYQLNYHFNET